LSSSPVSGGSAEFEEDEKEEEDEQQEEDWKGRGWRVSRIYNVRFEEMGWRRREEIEQ